MAVDQAAVLDALKAVRDPDLHRDIVSLGFVKNLRLDGGRVSFTIELTTPACPVKEQMREQAHAAVTGVPGVKAVNVDMSASVRAVAAPDGGRAPVDGVKNIMKEETYPGQAYLPLFVLAAPLAGLAIERLRPAALQAIVCLFLVNNARPYLFENWVRPWRGPNSIFRTTRDRQYFNDMDQFENRAFIEQAVNDVAALHCDLVGIDINQFHVEYPFQALLRARNPRVRFMHSSVNNASSRYAREGAAPCAILCMECAGVKSRTESYAGFGAPRQIGRGLLYVP